MCLGVWAPRHTLMLSPDNPNVLCTEQQPSCSSVGVQWMPGPSILT